MKAQEPTILGHRGARFEAPENTIPGFQHGIDIGLTAFELDIHMTADDQLVVIHDATMDRTTNGTGKVSELSLEDIQLLDARWIFPEFPPCTVPTFDEVLDIIANVDDMLVEIKTDDRNRLERIVPKVVQQLEQKNLQRQATITSFDSYALELAKHELPEGRRGFIGAWDDPRFLDLALALDCRQADVWSSVADRDLVEAARVSGMRIVGGPANTPEQLCDVLRLAPDMVCTDHPALIKRLFEREALRSAVPAGTA